MKRLLLLIMLLLPCSAMASIPEVQKLAQAFTDNDKASVVNISKQMLMMMGGGISGVEYVDSIVMLSSDNKSASKAINKRTKRIAKKYQLENLATLNEGGVITTVYIKTSNNRITEALVLVAEKSKVSLINISGKIPQEFATTLLSTLRF